MENIFISPLIPEKRKRNEFNEIKLLMALQQKSFYCLKIKLFLTKKKSFFMKKSDLSREEESNSFSLLLFESSFTFKKKMSFSQWIHYLDIKFSEQILSCIYDTLSGCAFKALYPYQYRYDIIQHSTKSLSLLLLAP